MRLLAGARHDAAPQPGARRAHVGAARRDHRALGAGGDSGADRAERRLDDAAAPERCQDIARALGLPAATPAEGVGSLATAVERLRDAVRVEPSFHALGVDEQAFLNALPQQALNGYEDQGAPANPRTAVPDDMRRPTRAAYCGAEGAPGG